MVLEGWAVTAIGSASAVCTTGAFVPQVVRVARLRRAQEISLTTFVVFSAGTFGWFLYGLLIDSLPIIVANVVTCALSLAMVLVRVRYGGKPGAPAAHHPSAAPADPRFSGAVEGHEASRPDLGRSG